MDLTGRIQLILKHQHLSSSQFADQIGVQRSSMSHILSGRNKPSLDFVNKVLTKFSFINSDWLLFGKGLMTRELRQQSLFGDEQNGASSDSADMHGTAEENTGNTNSNALNDGAATVKDGSNGSQIENGHDKLQKEKSNSGMSLSSKKIERVIVFYDDGTFDQYKPSL